MTQTTPFNFPDLRGPAPNLIPDEPEQNLFVSHRQIVALALQVGTGSLQDMIEFHQEWVYPYPYLMRGLCSHL